MATEQPIRPRLTQKTLGALGSIAGFIEADFIEEENYDTFMLAVNYIRKLQDWKSAKKKYEDELYKKRMAHLK